MLGGCTNTLTHTSSQAMTFFAAPFDGTSTYARNDGKSHPLFPLATTISSALVFLVQVSKNSSFFTCTLLLLCYRCPSFLLNEQTGRAHTFTQSHTRTLAER